MFLHEYNCIALTDVGIAIVTDYANEVLSRSPEGIHPDALPDDEVEVQADGSLRIGIEIPGYGKVERVVPADAWTWNDGRN